MLDWTRIDKSYTKATENPVRYGVYLTTPEVLELIDLARIAKDLATMVRAIEGVGP